MQRRFIHTASITPSTHLLSYPRHRAEHTRTVTPPEISQADQREGNTKQQRGALGGIEVALGLYEPSGRLPIQFPANMDTVEAQFEDVAKDMTPYTAAAGNSYDFGFGLNWSGVITD